MHTKWQVLWRIAGIEECWEQELEGELFDTEESAQHRAAQLDEYVPSSWGRHVVREVDA